MTTSTKTPTPARAVRGRFTLGEPQVCGPLTVHPVFGPRGGVRCRGLRAAMRRGVEVSELDEGVVNLVTVTNPTELPVLLYEGELILGAAQNRAIDQPTLVPAGARLQVGVSCVEQGRWDVGGAGGFAVSPDLLDPSLRAAKRGIANATAAARPDQGAVWREVSERIAAHGVASESEALSDVFDARRGDVDELLDGVSLIDGQLGMVTHIAGRPAALDLIGSRRVFAELHGRLLRGHALQALDTVVTDPRGVPGGAALTPSARRLLGDALGSDWRWLPGTGLGDLWAPTAPGLSGCCLRVGRELVAYSAFPARR